MALAMILFNRAPLDCHREPNAIDMPALNSSLNERAKSRAQALPERHLNCSVNG
jgi:hypothetical protein